MIQAVFFDLDGTLRDSLKPLRAAYDAFLSDFDCLGSCAEFDSLNGPGVSEIVVRLAAAHGLKDRLDALEQRYIAHQAQALAAGAPLHPGSRTLLARLQALNVPLALVTSAQDGPARQYLCSMNINCFQTLVCGNHIHRSKPDPAIYRLAVERMAVEPGRCVAVEDAPNGVAAAKGAGLRVVAVAHHLPRERLLACGADAVGRDLRHVQDILEKEIAS